MGSESGWMDGWIYSALPISQRAHPKNLGRIWCGGSLGRRCCRWACRTASPSWALLWVHGPHGHLGGRGEWAARRGRSEVKRRTSDVMYMACV